jgi:hypothetical protein
MRQLFLETYPKPMPEQQQIIDQTIENWKGNKHQIDDILVMGFKI